MSQPPTATHMSTQKSCSMESTTRSSSEPTEQEVIKVAGYLNSKLHEQIKQVKNFKIMTLPRRIAWGIFFYISDVILIKFLRILTQTVRQSRRSLFPDDLLGSRLVIKTVRIQNGLSVLQFITSNTSNMPFHFSLTEAILRYRGTQKLVTILNRIGAVSSTEKANCRAVKVVENWMGKGLKPS